MLGGSSEVLGDAGQMLVQRKDVTQRGLTDVEPYDHGLLVHKGKAGCQVGGGERLAFAGTGGGEEDDFLAFGQHVLEVGAQAAEDFFHDFVAVFADDDGRRTGFFHLGNVAYDCDIGDALDVSTPLDAEAQLTRQPDATDRNA